MLPQMCRACSRKSVLIEVSACIPEIHNLAMVYLHSHSAYYLRLFGIKLENHARALFDKLCAYQWINEAYMYIIRAVKTCIESSADHECAILVLANHHFCTAHAQMITTPTSVHLCSVNLHWFLSDLSLVHWFCNHEPCSHSSTRGGCPGRWTMDELGKDIKAVLPPSWG